MPEEKIESRYQLVAQAVEQGTDGELQPSLGNMQASEGSPKF